MVVSHRVGGRHEVNEVVGVLLIAGTGKLTGRDVWMVAITIGIMREQKGWIIVQAGVFVLSSNTTVEAAPVFTTVSDKSIPMYKAWAVA